MPHCSGICGRFKATKKPGQKWYRPGIKRCNFCKVFLKTESKYCPCCKIHLRTQGRGSDVKIKRHLPRVETNE